MTEFTIEINSPQDSHGRVSYTITWPADNQWKGGSGTNAQCRFGLISDFVKRCQERGDTTKFVVADI